MFPRAMRRLATTFSVALAACTAAHAAEVLEACPTVPCVDYRDPSDGTVYKLHWQDVNFLAQACSKDLIVVRLIASPS
jgi:hypothetical protein